MYLADLSRWHMICVSLSMIACPLCDSPKTQIRARLQSEQDGRAYAAVVCRSCEATFAHPRLPPSFDALQAVYDTDYTEGQRTISRDADALLRAATHRQMALVETYVAPGRALNVGAMNPAVTVLAARGWDLELVDVSQAAAQTARAWGCRVTVSRVEDYTAPAGSFALIKLGHVIEHLDDPRAAIARLVPLLQPGGVLLIDTDNARGLKTRIETGVRRLLGDPLSAALVQRLTGKNLRKRYGRLTPPEHLYAFSPASLTRLVTTAGLTVRETLTPAWGDPTWFPLAAPVRVMDRVCQRIDAIGAAFGAGEVVAVLAQRS